MLDGVVMSDLHLGAESCQVRAIIRFLEELPDTRRLILNGDVLENTEHRLTKHHWKVLSLLRKLSDQLELVWVRGNHDFDADAIAHLIGASFVPEYDFQSADRRVLCVHGDSWDRFLVDHPYLTNVADWFYLWMQRLSRSLAVSAKRSSKTFLRCIERVRDEARGYAKGKKMDVVVCGHTHHAEWIKGDGQWCGRPEYYNTGCWTDHHCHFWTVKGGDPQLHEIRTAELAAATEVFGVDALDFRGREKPGTCHASVAAISPSAARVSEGAAPVNETEVAVFTNPDALAPGR
jgi:UDP-2,3-diacylglucosamine pyrophosphatase LpxH